MSYANDMSVESTAGSRLPVPGGAQLDPVAALRASVLVLARRLRNQQGAGVGGQLSATELAVLGRLARCGPMTPGQLAKAEHVQPPSMTRIVERLEARGLLARQPHPTDRRQVLISRTEAVNALVTELRAVRAAWLASHLERLDAEDQHAIAAALPALQRLAELA